MSKKNTNPYRGKGYVALMDFVMKKQILVPADLMKFATDSLKSGGMGLSKTAATASVTVILSPRGPERMGNYSAMGHIYFMEELKNGSLRLKFYPKDKQPPKHVRPVKTEVAQTKSAKVKTAKVAKKATKKKAATKKKVAKKKATAKKKVAAPAPVEAKVETEVTTPTPPAPEAKTETPEVETA
mgnify:CR=1 FL=1